MVPSSSFVVRCSGVMIGLAESSTIRSLRTGLRGYEPIPVLLQLKGDERGTSEDDVSNFEDIFKTVRLPNCLVRELGYKPSGQLVLVIRVEAIPEHGIALIIGNLASFDEGLAKD